jgi:hypothetical protein
MFTIFPAGSMISTGVAFAALVSGIINYYLMSVTCGTMASLTSYSWLD